MEQSKRDLPERAFEFARRVVKLCRALDQGRREQMCIVDGLEMH